MTVFRVNKNKNYTVMSNFHLRDKNLSLKAKGLLSVMLSLPDDWDYTVRGLCTITGEGKDSIHSALKNLETTGYLVRHQLRDEEGHLSNCEYIIYETPNQNAHSDRIEGSGMDPDPPLAGFPPTGKPLTEEPPSANPPLLNTNNTKILNVLNKDSNGGPQPPFAELISVWNAIPSVIQIKGITVGSERERNALAFLNNYSIEDVKNAADKIGRSAYLQAKKPRFDWFLRNIDKIIEGNYDEEYGKKEGNVFNGFHQRKYDYEKLESMLLNKKEGKDDGP